MDNNIKETAEFSTKLMMQIGAHFAREILYFKKQRPDLVEHIPTATTIALMVFAFQIAKTVMPEGMAHDIVNDVYSKKNTAEENNESVH
jgi:hypothetical protein